MKNLVFKSANELVENIKSKKISMNEILMGIRRELNKDGKSFEK